MLNVIRRHRVIFFVLVLMLLLVFYMLVTGQNTSKIPSRGVFVAGSTFFELILKGVT